MELKSLQQHIDDTIKANGGEPGHEDTEPRGHLGASIIGKDCWRELWYSFRWFAPRDFEGRMLRLFASGHKYEPRFIKLLNAVGISGLERDPATGKQYRFSEQNGHFGGSMDAKLWGLQPWFTDSLGVSYGSFNLPPETVILGEFKTHGQKSFDNLIEKKVAKAKPEHEIQMSLYTESHHLPLALYCAVNKNTEDLYFEFRQPQPQLARDMNNKAGNIIRSPSPPPRISDSPSWGGCRFCDYRMTCHFGQPPARNCRSCRFSFPTLEGQWACNKWNNSIIPFDFQQKGCDSYTVIHD